MTTHNFLFIIDHYKDLRLNEDTSIALMQEAQQRGHRVWICHVEDLYIEGNKPYARMRRIKVEKKNGLPVFVELEGKNQALENMGVVFMRKDPPFTIDYFMAVSILGLINKKKTFVLNDPDALRTFNEKLGIMQFPQFKRLIPPMLVTKKYDQLNAFLKKHRAVVLKPLDGHSGRDVFVLDLKDKNKNSLFENLTAGQTRFVMAQKYLPQVKKGDKRILVLNGKVLGALNRKGAPDDHRSNLYAGGSAFRTQPTAVEQKMCTEVGTELAKKGLYFIGIDIIGEKITEINVTSPGTLPKMNHFYNLHLERTVIDFLEERCKKLIL